MAGQVQSGTVVICISNIKALPKAMLLEGVDPVASDLPSPCAFDIWAFLHVLLLEQVHQLFHGFSRLHLHACCKKNHHLPICSLSIFRPNQRSRFEHDISQALPWPHGDDPWWLASTSHCIFASPLLSHARLLTTSGWILRKEIPPLEASNTALMAHQDTCCRCSTLR